MKHSIKLLADVTASDVIASAAADLASPGDETTGEPKSRSRHQRWGGFLVKKGNQLYDFVKDKRHDQRLLGRVRRPLASLITKGKPIAGPGVAPPCSERRSGRPAQLEVTYKGHQTLYFVTDRKQGTDGPARASTSSAAPWWVLSPEGKETTMSSAPSTPRTCGLCPLRSGDRGT